MSNTTHAIRVLYYCNPRAIFFGNNYVFISKVILTHTVKRKIETYSYYNCVILNFL